jgi:hypothetical protein
MMTVFPAIVGVPVHEGFITDPKINGASPVRLIFKVQSKPTYALEAASNSIPTSVQHSSQRPTGTSFPQDPSSTIFLAHINSSDGRVTGPTVFPSQSM